MPKLIFTEYATTIIEALKLEGIKLREPDKNAFLTGDKDIFFSELEIDFDSMMQVEICAYLEARYGSNNNLVDAILKSSSFYELFKNLDANKSNSLPKNTQNTIKNREISKQLKGFDLQTIESFKSLTDLRKALVGIENLLTPLQICSLYESNKKEINFLEQLQRSSLENPSITITPAKTNSEDGKITCQPLNVKNFARKYLLRRNTLECKINFILEWIAYHKYIIDHSNFRHKNHFNVIKNKPGYTILSAEKFQQNSTKTLLFLFTGRALRIMAPLPWVLSNINPLKYDIVLFKYPRENNGYHLGLPGINDGLHGLANFIIKSSFHYKDCSFLGTSGGGLAAILFSTFFPNASCISAAGNKINDPRWHDKLNLFDLSNIDSKKLYLFGRESNNDKSKAIELKNNFPEINTYEVSSKSGAVRHSCLTPIIMSQGINRLFESLNSERL